MSAPHKVLLKRKRTEEPPDALLLARANVGGTPQKRVRYILHGDGASNVVDNATHQTGKPPLSRQAKRRFHLRRFPATDHDGSKDKLPKDATSNLPTFEAERRQSAQQSHIHDSEMTEAPSDSFAPVKRPGRGSAVRPAAESTKGKRSPGNKADMQALAHSMHQFALDELAKIPKPTTTTKPRMSPSQAKSRHNQNMAKQAPIASSQPEEAMEIDDNDFVYDTYILTTSDAETGPEDNVGYLVIREDDEAYWQTFLDGLDAEPEEAEDDEDENAEDYYAADYPEDEMASDDEHNQNAYSYRPRANSDLEQWDHRQDSEDEDEYDNPRESAMIKQWEAELGIRKSDDSHVH